MAVKALTEERKEQQTASSHEIKAANSSEFRASVIMESGVATPAELAMLQAQAGDAIASGCRPVLPRRPGRN